MPDFGLPTKETKEQESLGIIDQVFVDFDKDSDLFGRYVTLSKKAHSNSNFTPVAIIKDAMVLRLSDKCFTYNPEKRIELQDIARKAINCEMVMKMFLRRYKELFPSENGNGEGRPENYEGKGAQYE